MRPISATTTILAAIGVCLLIAAPASSEESDFARNGWYVGAGAVGASFVRVDQINSDLDADETPGFSLLGGYRITPIMAFEVEFEMLPTTDLEGAGNSAELELWTLTANMKVFMWTGRFQPFALMGLGGMRSDLDQDSAAGPEGTESDFAFRFGAGLDFYITENIVATAGARYMLPTGSDLEDLDYVSYGGGVIYRF